MTQTELSFEIAVYGLVCLFRSSDQKRRSGISSQLEGEQLQEQQAAIAENTLQDGFQTDVFETGCIWFRKRRRFGHWSVPRQQLYPGSEAQ